ncbi:MAG: hypothetical protein M3350_05130 [Actinomycetota bacterium]|nr:hypothetical protein [Actinomycetota bacterium]
MPQLYDSAIVLLVSNLFAISVALLPAHVVKKLNDRQEERAARLQDGAQALQ